MPEQKKLTFPQIQRRAREDRPLTMVTCYDYSSAHWVQQAGVDMVLVGDSLGMTMLGYESTLPVTMDDMVRHGQAVRRGARNTFLVVDMPYMSYQAGVERAVLNAGRLMAETGCDAVKVEGAGRVLAAVQGMVSVGIPVMGHLGLTPQSASSLGGFRLQGKTAKAAQAIAADAHALEDAGAFALLVELVPSELCAAITEHSAIPVIGLGAGPAAHGQLLILHDLLGLYPNFKPRMAKCFQSIGAAIVDGLKTYRDEVQLKEFPRPENAFHMAGAELRELRQLLVELEASADGG